jgi:6-phosphogluconolactonase
MAEGKISARACLAAVTVALLCALGTGGCGSGSGGASSGGGGQGMSEVLYVATGNNGLGQIMSFNIDQSTGVLTSSNAYSAPEYIFQMAVDPGEQFLYASDFDSGGVRVYSIAPTTGALTEVAGSPFFSPNLTGNGGPVSVSVDGKLVFFSDATGDVTTFFASAGVLTPSATSITDMNQPNQFAVDLAGQFLYVADLSDFGQAQFSVFSINHATGALTPASGSPFLFQSNSGTYGIALSPAANFLYASLSNAAGVDALSVNTNNGSLALVAGSPWQAQFAPKSLAIDPKGRFLYVAVTGVGSIFAFTINSTTGALSQVGTYSGEGNLAVDPSGKFLYASYNPAINTGEISAYQIDQTSGALSPVPGSPFMVHPAI